MEYLDAANERKATLESELQRLPELVPLVAGFWGPNGY
jgi:hypothetical protein